MSSLQIFTVQTSPIQLNLGQRWTWLVCPRWFSRIGGNNELALIELMTALLSNNFFATLVSIALLFGLSPNFFYTVLVETALLLLTVLSEVASSDASALPWPSLQPHLMPLLCPQPRCNSSNNLPLTLQLFICNYLLILSNEWMSSPLTSINVSSFTSQILMCGACLNNNEEPMTSRVIFKTHQQKHTVRQDLASNMHSRQTKSLVGAQLPMHCAQSQEPKLRQTVFNILPNQLQP